VRKHEAVMDDESGKSKDEDNVTGLESAQNANMHKQKHR